MSPKRGTAASFPDRPPVDERIRVLELWHDTYNATLAAGRTRQEAVARSDTSYWPEDEPFPTGYETALLGTSPFPDLPPGPEVWERR